MIKSFLKRYGLLIVFFIVFSVVAISSFNYVQTQEKKLPIYSPSMVSDELVEEELRYVKKYHRISDFSLLNQNGNNVTQEDYKNKIYVADFFFTTCPSICPIMTKNMKILQDQFIDDPNVLLLSHSVTPKIDTVAQLKKYAVEKGVMDKKWHLVTGSKKEIYDLARKSYLAVKTNSNQNLHTMIHTENFILVDPDRRIRGFYDGTIREDMTKINEDISILKLEYSID